VAAPRLLASDLDGAAGGRPALPLRVRPLADVDFAAQRRATGSSPLLEAAEERISGVSVPAVLTVFVHGDLWQGNTLWTGDTCEGMVDWDAAGVGHSGIDLGTLRLDAAILFGLPAAAEILEGWRQATSQAAEAMAYWDVVAALTSPTDMGQWLPVAHDHGRVDLDAATLMDRRDAFLRAALDRLDRE
jgi:aminoglycoside phosphotransferase (APT) family kinase protein